MNGKDMVAVMMAINKLDGPRFTAKDEEVTSNTVCPGNSPFAHFSDLVTWTKFNFQLYRGLQGFPCQSNSKASHLLYHNLLLFFYEQLP